MRASKTKIILFFLFIVSLTWYIYKSNYLTVKGFKRLKLSVKTAFIIAWAVFGIPSGVSARDATPSEVEAFANPPISRPALSGKGLFQKNIPQTCSTNPEDNNGNGNSGSPLDNTDPKPVKKEVQKPIEVPYVNTETNQENDSDSEQCSVDEELELKVAIAKDGTLVKVYPNKVRDKGLHIPEFLPKEFLDGKFNVDEAKDLAYPDRLEYLRNKENLPDDVVSAAQDKIFDFFSAEDNYLVPGKLGVKEIRGTIFINLRLNMYGFRDNDTYRYRSAGSMTDEKIRQLADSDFHLFPNAGK